MEFKNGVYVVRTGYVLPKLDWSGWRGLLPEYLRVVCEQGACERCREHEWIPLPFSEGRPGENLPPFHPNCKCGYEPWKIDPWEAEARIWDIVMDDTRSETQRAQAIIDFYQIKEFSNQFVRLALRAAKDRKTAPERMEAIFRMMADAPPQLVENEEKLPEEKVDFSYYRYEDYKGLTLPPPKTMQDMAYTDKDGFRRIHVPELGEGAEDAYMAAMPSYYIKTDTGIDANGVVYRVYLANGKSFYLVAGDQQADNITNPDTHQYTYAPELGVTEENANVIEFIVDADNMESSMLGNNFRVEGSPFDADILRIERLPYTVLGGKTK